MQTNFGGGKHLKNFPHHVLSHRHLSIFHCQSHTPCAGSDGDEESIFCTIFVILARKYLHLVDATRLRYVEAPERVPHHVLSHHHLSTPHWQSSTPCAGPDYQKHILYCCIILVIPRKYLHLVNANKFWCWEAPQIIVPHHVLSHHHPSTPHCCQGPLKYILCKLCAFFLFLRSITS